MTKAQRIFRETRYQSKRHIEVWGAEYNSDGTVVGWNNLYCGDDETICTRTINAVEKELNKARNDLSIEFKLEVISKEEFNRRNEVLGMVESTIRNARNAIMCV